MRLLLIVSVLMFVAAAALGFGYLGGASLHSIAGLIAAGLAAWVLALLVAAP